MVEKAGSGQQEVRIATLDIFFFERLGKSNAIEKMRGFLGHRTGTSLKNI